jgi:hypothetical protein
MDKKVEEYFLALLRKEAEKIKRFYFPLCG